MNGDKKKVLIIDDEVDLRDAISTALGYEGYDVIGASDGRKGLESALVNKPDLIFLDILMPGMDGVEMLKELRQDEWGKDVPVIVMTAADDMQKLAEVIDQGANEYVTKASVTLSTIVQKANKHLKKQAS